MVKKTTTLDSDKEVEITTPDLISIDPANNAGIALFRKGQYLASMHCDMRVPITEEALYKFVTDNKIEPGTWTVYEYSTFGFKRAIWTGGFWSGYLCSSLGALPFNTLRVSPKEWRKIVFGNGDATKEKALWFVNNCVDGFPGTDSHDEAEAVCIGVAALIQVGMWYGAKESK